MLVIGLSGKMGSGKDFIARQFIMAYLKSHHPALNIGFLAFADALKLRVLEKYPDIQWEDVYPPNGMAKTERVRKLLQHEGNAGREQSSDYWIRRYENWTRLMEQNGVDILLTTDVRFEAEKEYIQNVRKGIVCRVNAPNRTYQTQDSSLMRDVSECSLDRLSNQEWDYIFENNQDVHCLEEAMDRFQEFVGLLNKMIVG